MSQATDQYKAAVARYERAERKVAELERLCDATYVAQGADAYNHACDRMDQLTKDLSRAAAEIVEAGHFVWGNSCLDAAVRIKEQAERIAELTDALQFVERWAVHHGSKDSTSAESALSVIQHYPPIAAITAGYADGKTPDTFNPFARIAELERQLDAAKKDAARHQHFANGGSLTVVVPTPTDEKPNRKVTIIYGPNSEPGFSEAFGRAIDAAIKANEAKQ